MSNVHKVSIEKVEDRFEAWVMFTDRDNVAKSFDDFDTAQDWVDQRVNEVYEPKGVDFSQPEEQASA